MLTDQDIKKLIEAEKEVFTTKADFELLRGDFRTLQTSVDGYTKLADTYYKEVIVLISKVTRMEEWIQAVARKVGVEYKP